MRLGDAIDFARRVERDGGRRAIGPGGGGPGQHAEALRLGLFLQFPKMMDGVRGGRGQTEGERCGH